MERKKLRSQTQLPGETVSEFLAALRHQGSFCAYGTALDEHLCDVFLEGLDFRRVQDRILRECVGTAVPTLNRAVQLALQFEQLARTSEQFHQRQTSVSGTSSSSGEVQYIEQPRFEQAHAPRRGYQDGQGRLASQVLNQDGHPGFSTWPYRQYTPTPRTSRMTSCPPAVSHVPRPQARVGPQQRRDVPPSRMGERAGGPDLCWFCGRRNHARDVCPALHAQCFRCLKMGHFAAVCRSRQPPSDSFVYDQRQASLPSRGHAHERQHGPSPPWRSGPATVGVHDDCDYQYNVTSVDDAPVRTLEGPVVDRSRLNAFIADVQVNGLPLKLLIDTGSHVSILNARIFNDINRSGQIQLHPPARRLVHYMHETIPVLGSFTGQVVFKNRFASLEFYVCQNGRSLLGIDAVRELQITLSGADHSCSYVNAADGRPDPQQDVTSVKVPQRRPFTVSSRQPPHQPSSSDVPGILFSSQPGVNLSQAHLSPDKQVDLEVSSRTPQSTAVAHSASSTSRDVSQLPPGFEDFQHLFSPELGLVHNHTHTVKVRYNVPPVQSKLRRLPITLRDAVSEEIFRLEHQGIIERVNASEWVSPIVVVRKQDGSIRLCVDLRAPNQAIIIDSFPLPHIEELLNSLQGASHFSKLDLASAYHQIRLAPESRDLTAFITHEGLFRFKRVCFGLASAPAAFQDIMSKVLRNCKGVRFYLDDIIVYGSSQREHDENLREVLSCISRAGMKLNRKGVFRVQELSYLGHRLSTEGLAPLPSKVDDVQNFEAPSDPSKLKAFLGLVEYYNKFIPHCSTLVEPLRRLLRKDVPFVWSPEVEASFRKVKGCLKNAPILSLFDPTLPVVVSTDASMYGLGAVLQQQIGNQLRTIAFASRSLTNAERMYSTGEKEALACLWACEKWHVYLWGRHFVIRTDHQALVTLLSNKGSGVRPLRITRWTARLLNYNFTMEYQKGADNVVADALSRLPVSDTENGTQFEEDVVSLIMLPLTLTDFQEATTTDVVLPRVIRYTLSSWPDDSFALTDLRPYFNVRDQLSLHNGILFQGEKIVVPEQLRDRIVQLGHETHQGISRTTTIIRDKYWWPRMSQEIKERIQHCTVCNSTDKTAKRAPAPLQPVEFPKQPWEKLGLDIVGPVEHAPPSQRFFLVLIDYHSKWPEVQPVASVTSTTVINFLKTVFAREGLPCEIVSDNGVQFVSHEFQEFLHQHGIKHSKTSLYHPQANGQVERFNRVLKSCLQLAAVQGRPLPDAVRDYLEAYRRTPHSATGQAPSLLLHGRTHRSKIDIQGMSTPEAPAVSSRTDLHARVRSYQQNMKSYSDSRKAVRWPRFVAGQAVRIYRPQHKNKLQTKYSTPQIIQTQVGPATYKFADGRIWNADKLTRAFIPPEQQDADLSWDDEDENEPAPIRHHSPLGNPTVTAPPDPVCSPATSRASCSSEPAVPGPSPQVPSSNSVFPSLEVQDPLQPFIPMATSSPAVSNPGTPSSIPPLEESVNGSSTHPCVPEATVTTPTQLYSRPVRERRLPQRLKDYVLSFYGNSNLFSSSGNYHVQ